MHGEARPGKRRVMGISTIARLLPEFVDAGPGKRAAPARRQV